MRYRSWLFLLVLLFAPCHGVGTALEQRAVAELRARMGTMAATRAESLAKLLNLMGHTSSTAAPPVAAPASIPTPAPAATGNDNAGGMDMDNLFLKTDGNSQELVY